MSIEAPPLMMAHSLPGDGCAGLTPMLSILGTQVIAMPTILLTATANHSGIRKWPMPIVEQLDASLRFQQALGHCPELFVGYLTGPAQAREISAWLAANRALLGRVYVDPVCGDNGNPYVDPELVGAWGAILRHADIAFPNATEWSLIARANTDIEPDVWWAGHSMPTTIVVTSSTKGRAFGNRVIESGREHFIERPYLKANYRGTGDVFAAYCLEALRSGDDPCSAVHQASVATESIIVEAIQRGRNSLRIQPGKS